MSDDFYNLYTIIAILRIRVVYMNFAMMIGFTKKTAETRTVAKYFLKFHTRSCYEPFVFCIEFVVLSFVFYFDVLFLHAHMAGQIELVYDTLIDAVSRVHGFGEICCM